MTWSVTSVLLLLLLLYSSGVLSSVLLALHTSGTAAQLC
jgi:hypothetical protein